MIHKDIARDLGRETLSNSAKEVRQSSCFVWIGPHPAAAADSYECDNPGRAVWRVRFGNPGWSSRSGVRTSSNVYCPGGSHWKEGCDCHCRHRLHSGRRYVALLHLHSLARKLTRPCSHASSCTRRRSLLDHGYWTPRHWLRRWTGGPHRAALHRRTRSYCSSRATGDAERGCE